MRAREEARVQRQRQRRSFANPLTPDTGVHGTTSHMSKAAALVRRNQHSRTITDPTHSSICGNNGQNNGEEGQQSPAGLLDEDGVIGIEDGMDKQPISSLSTGDKRKGRVSYIAHFDTRLPPHSTARLVPHACEATLSTALPIIAHPQDNLPEREKQTKSSEFIWIQARTVLQGIPF